MFRKKSREHERLGGMGWDSVKAMIVIQGRISGFALWYSTLVILGLADMLRYFLVAP